MNEILKDFDFKTRMMFRIFVVVVRILNSTYRKRIFHVDRRQQAMAAHPKGAFVFATWHGNSYAGTIVHGHQKFSPLCSRSKDGSMVAYLCEKIGLKPARGSSSRGGKEAREELLENIKQGYSAAITVDGPKGPPFVTKAGVISVAKESGAMIIPLATMGEKFWQLRSWDRLKIPKPFSRVAIIYGEPFAVGAEAQGDTFEEYQMRLTKDLNELESGYRDYFSKWNEGSKSFGI
jgi:hypothetical protein